MQKLPAGEREVVGLTLYHGWGQEPIAELFEIDERAARRRLRRPAEVPGGALGGRLPAE